MSAPADPDSGVERPDDDGLWQHVAGLRPSLRRHVRILVQEYRGDRWYLLHDETAGRFTRFNADAYAVLGRLDGDLSMQEVLELANAGRKPHERLTRDDVLQILAQLHGVEVLRGSLPLSAQDVLNRYQTSERYRRRGALSNPLALRLPLFDPDRLLDRLAPLARLLFSRIGLTAWLLVVGSALLLALLNGQALLADVSAKTLSTTELLTFWLLFPLVKALHELGHGLAVKAWGGEVHETGINLLVFMPVPYVDASASWAFRDKRRRALVGGAGILVELFLAAVALWIWLLVEPGLVRDVALNVVLIGSVSTLLFNGNPLLRFDGYYVLEDLLEIPNLATRAGRYYLYLVQRYLLGLADARSPVSARGERGWFLFFGFAAPVYRLGVLVGIGLYLAGEFFVLGVVLAAWAVLMQVLRPLFRSLVFLATSQRLAARRLRGAVLVGGVLLALAGVLNLNMPLVSHAEGVVWSDARGEVHSAASGFVRHVHAGDGGLVAAGEVLLELDDPELRARLRGLKARLRELQTQWAAERQNSRVRAAMVDEDIDTVRAELEQVESDLAGLIVRSPIDGRFVLQDLHGLRGRYVAKGELLGHVMHDGEPVVRAVVGQDRIGLLRVQRPSFEVSLASDAGTPLPASWLREVPAGTAELPSAALGAMGGGRMKVDLQDPNGRTATEKVFQFDLALPGDAPVHGIGGRVYVRMAHGSEPLWQQWSREVRQLLLSRLEV